MSKLSNMISSTKQFCRRHRKGIAIGCGAVAFTAVYLVCRKKPFAVAMRETITRRVESVVNTVITDDAVLEQHAESLMETHTIETFLKDKRSYKFHEPGHNVREHPRKLKNGKVIFVRGYYKPTGVKPVLNAA